MNEVERGNPDGHPLGWLPLSLLERAMRTGLRAERCSVKGANAVKGRVVDEDGRPVAARG